MLAVAGETNTSKESVRVLLPRLFATVSVITCQPLVWNSTIGLVAVSTMSGVLPSVFVVPAGKCQREEVMAPLPEVLKNFTWLPAQTYLKLEEKWAIGAHGDGTVSKVPVVIRLESVQRLLRPATDELAAASHLAFWPSVNITEQYEYSI